MILVIIVAFGLLGRSPLVVPMLATIMFIALLRERQVARGPDFEIYSFGLMSRATIENATARHLVATSGLVVLGLYAVGFAVGKLLILDGFAPLSWTDLLSVGFLGFLSLVLPELVRSNVRKEIQEEDRGS
jgi:hypothetical protein